MRTGHMAIGLAAVVSMVPASFAQESRVLDHCKPAGTGIEAEERQTDRGPASNTGVFVAVPIGRVCVGPDVVDGERSYVRRITAKEGMAIVEVSTTPFLEGPPGIDQVIGRSDQPASW